MAFEIRLLQGEALDAALALARDVFFEFEAPEYGPQGISAFRRDILENPRFYQACLEGENRIWGAYCGETLVSIMGLQGACHICLSFTCADMQRQGAASSLFHAIVAQLDREGADITQLSVNASPYGLPFYLHLGFYPTGPEQCVNGIRFTPMLYPLPSSSRRNTTYCGLWCGDCIPGDHALFALALALKQRLEQVGFRHYAAYKEAKVPSFSDYDTFEAVLAALEDVHCTRTCHEGPLSKAGCAQDCHLRSCALEKGLDGCWACPDFERCAQIADMQQLHPDILHNLRTIRRVGIDRWVGQRGRHYRF